MIQYHSINGKLVPAGEASLGIQDLALLRGYGIFDFFLVKKGVPLFLNDYIKRFNRSASLMRLRIPVSDKKLKQDVHRVIQANELTEGAIRIILTGGYSEDAFTPSRPNLLILAHPNHPPPPFLYAQGARMILRHFEREMPEVKTLNYANAIRLQPLLKRFNAYEALYHNGRVVTEAYRSNFFMVLDGPVLVTPSEHVLQGITRSKVVQLALKKYPVEIRPVYLEELPLAKEAFITGSNKSVMPVIRIAYTVVGDGMPGPVTQEMMSAFDELVAGYVQEQQEKPLESGQR